VPRKIRVDQLGKTFEFPDGTSDADIDRIVRTEIMPAYAKQNSAQPAQAAPAEKSFGEKAWDWVNRGLLSPDVVGEVINVAPAGHGVLTQEEVARRQGQMADSGKEFSPVDYLEHYALGVQRDIKNTLSSFTSPLAIATMGAGALGKAGKALQTLAGAGFAGAGVSQVVDPDGASDADKLQNQLMGGAMIAGGAGVVKELGVKPQSPRGILSEQMAKPSGEGRFTRAEVNSAARENGVNLDLAQATESPTAIGAKRANQYSLASQSAYDKASKTNSQALESWADKNVSSLAKDAAPRESLGPAIQNKLKQNVADMEQQSGRILDNLTKEAGDKQPDARGIYQLADNIVSAEKDYYTKNPNLKPGKAWNIVEKLANRAKELKGETRLVEGKVLDENGKPIMREVQVKPQVTPDTWSDLHKLRSDLMNEYRSNPEIVGSRAEGWLKQMVSAIDDTMTSEAFSKLSPEQVAKFRAANQIYADMKNTYDNPQSPFYHAVRAQSPSQVPAMLTRTPELAKKAQAVIGDLKGSLQRNYAETLINGKDGVRDFANLNRRLSNIPDDVLIANLGENGAKQMRLLGEVARKVAADTNPSGTAKVGVPAGELGMLLSNPLGGVAELGAQFGGAKMMNSPRIVDFLTMKPSEFSKAKMPKGKR
jgi:hypothetical protein